MAAEEGWLRERLPRAEFTGVLKGEALSTAYANMDLFVFPSHTDTFGNVVLEALASGVPAIVTPDGGPCTIVRDGETGRIVPDEQFAAAVAEVLGRCREARADARGRTRLCAYCELGLGLRRRLQGLRNDCAEAGGVQLLAFSSQLRSRECEARAIPSLLMMRGLLVHPAKEVPVPDSFALLANE